MLELVVLASGSTGNAAIVRDAATGRALLVDCGICKRKFFARCAAAGVDPLAIEATLVTHAHTDHTSGLGVVLRGLHKKGCAPTLYTHPLVRAQSKPIAEVEGLVQQCEIVHGNPFEVAGIMVTPFPTSHDAAGSTCFRFEVEGDALGYVTDTGIVTPQAHDSLQGVRILAIESNHDVTMLKEGPYPYPLKQRILGRRGHLSNMSSGQLLARVLNDHMKAIFLGHLSKENNLPELAYETVRVELLSLQDMYRPDELPIRVAQRDHNSQLLEW